MCAIAGILKFDPRETVDERRLLRMRDLLRHRGPDGEGTFLEGPVGLGHRRLAIVDVAGGRQPMCNEDGSIWIVFNGEIYNHAELRPELLDRGHRYRTWSDTETILHLYEEEGERAVERLSGMFAFAIWDSTRRRLFLARDRLGIKPLYYAITEGELTFASEIKALVEGSPLRARLNHAVLPEFLATGFVAGEETFFAGVRQLLPGRTLTWSPDEGFRERRYWRLPAASGDSETAGAAESATELRERLRRSVKSHLMSDVPLGLFLSGGIDSAGLLGLMAGMVREPVKTFAVGFNEPEANELAYARIASQRAGAEHREIVVTPEEFWAALPRLVWHEDEPIAFPSSVALHFVSRLARDHVKVVLTGEGADELFLGYNRYRVAAWNESLGRSYWSLVPSAVRRRLARTIPAMPGGVRRYVGRSFFALEPGPRSLFFENFAVFPDSWLRRIVADDQLVAGRDPYASGLAHYREAGSDALDRMSRADLQTYLVRLLMKQDKMSMAASIESRVPYLDPALVEHVVGLPARLKLRGFTTKAVLREALKTLVPPEILARRKMGFPVPVGRWLRTRFWPMVEEFVLGPRTLERGLFDPAVLRLLADEHRREAAEHGDRLWLLITLEIWQRVFVDGEEAAAVVKAA
jgi:asparagine synthase (glutamine-hydrolysing)